MPWVASAGTVFALAFATAFSKRHAIKKGPFETAGTLWFRRRGAGGSRVWAAIERQVDSGKNGRRSGWIYQPVTRDQPLSSAHIGLESR
jgi:hypothetical protein